MQIQERLEKYFSREPEISRAAFVAPSADVNGAVTLGQDSSVWYQCVLRGDIHTIEIGEGTNIQDGSVVHLADDYGVKIGAYTTVGHMAMIHACEIGNETLIGMSATVLDGAKIGNRCIIGAGSLVTKGVEIPDGSMVLGAPGKVVRSLSREEQAGLKKWADKYIPVARAHAARFSP